MTKFMTKEAIKIVNNRLETRSLKSLIRFTEKISSMTKGRSGFFGISFNVLIPYLKNRQKEQLKS